MKKLFFATFLVLLIAITGNAQEKYKSSEGTTVSDTIRPQYPGGTEAFYHYVQDGIKKRHLPSKSGRIVVYFIIEKDGSLSNIKIIQGIEQKVDDRVVELVKESPKWIPTYINGTPRRSSYSLPITINLHK